MSTEVMVRAATVGEVFVFLCIRKETHVGCAGAYISSFPSFSRVVSTPLVSAIIVGL